MSSIADTATSKPSASSAPTGGELPKAYEPSLAEPRVRQRWADANPFHPDPARVLSGERQPYCILIPPPNVTAALHIGHALNNTLQDVLARVHRMKGYETLWMPGTDHAGIATQSVVENRLYQQEGKRRTDYQRDDFVSRVQAWKDEYEKTIIDQLRALGCSCDWDRQRFTMDEVCARAVREAFFRLFRDGLIYRGKRLVNWDPVTRTALADDEVDMKEVEGKFYYLRYPLIHPSDSTDHKPVTWGELAARGYPGAEQHPDDGQAWVTVATTRPETYLGDTAVAMNPKDPRAGALRGLLCELPLVGRRIPIVEDDYVVMPASEGEEATDPKAKFATGFLKVTPAHDPNDWEIGRRHNLAAINVMAPDASISDKHGWEDVGDAKLFVGLSREAAREKVIQEFASRSVAEGSEGTLLEKIVPYAHSVGHSYRSHVPIEPYLSDQWYCKVSDDRLVGEAQRALDPKQRSGEPRPLGSGKSDFRNEPRPLGSGPELPSATGSTQPSASAQGTRHAYLITFTTYGTRLHGDPRGSVAKDDTRPGAPLVPTNKALQQAEARQLVNEPIKLDSEQRRIVADAIAGVCDHQNWKLHACNVRTNHVHVVVEAPVEPEKVMLAFKAYATRAMRLQDQSDADKVWTRHGSTRWLNDETSFSGALRYVLEEQGADDIGVIRLSNRDPGPLPHGRGSSGTRAGDAGLSFTPARYAKTYEAWHDNLRDWCISRQLWWGHRIPVWSREVADDNAKLWERDGCIPQLGDPENATHCVHFEHDPDGQIATVRVCLAPGQSHDEKLLESIGFTQDPDVLDTWFSSALWPISTMGWPDPSTNSQTRDLLDAFNPSSVLVTGRDIITLWVSRMVMFNRFLHPNNGPNHNAGGLPFKDVYINPIIQDGHGQRMSKSLGNGVDPRDIVKTHGADALRYTLVGLATATQDVRLPVDMICPHTGQTFTPKWITTPGGATVAAPIQDSPAGGGKKIATVYGVLSGQATPTADMPLAGNTSSKFDAGRNFCNKVWNATRFALSNLAQQPQQDSHDGSSVKPVTPTRAVDRWMLSRLAGAVSDINSAVAEYRFSDYATTLYDLVWRDFCDWYLEAIKPTVKTDPAQRTVLAATLDAILRLLHPVAPFLTETLWDALRTVNAGAVRGVTLGDSQHNLLSTANWPTIDASLRDEHAEQIFARVQALVGAVREARTQHQAPERRKITLHMPADLINEFAATKDLIETLAGIGTIIADAPAGPSVVARYEGVELRLSDLADALDPAAEKARLEQLIAKLDKEISAYEGRLNNPGYADKAPAKLVNETRAKLEQARAERSASAQALESL